MESNIEIKSEATVVCEKEILSINNLGYDLMQICLRDNIQ